MATGECESAICTVYQSPFLMTELQVRMIGGCGLGGQMMS